MEVPLGGLWLQISLSAKNRIIRSNLKNTVKYVIYDTTYNTPTPYDLSLGERKSTVMKGVSRQERYRNAIETL